jgi:hypothetical protein
MVSKSQFSGFRIAIVAHIFVTLFLYLQKLVLLRQEAAVARSA